MSTKNYIRENPTLVAVLIFIIIFGAIQIMKPSCFYNKDGSIREFGIGYLLQLNICLTLILQRIIFLMQN